MKLIEKERMRFQIFIDVVDNIISRRLTLSINSLKNHRIKVKQEEELSKRKVILREQKTSTIKSISNLMFEKCKAMPKLQEDRSLCASKINSEGSNEHMRIFINQKP